VRATKFIPVNMQEAAIKIKNAAKGTELPYFPCLIMSKLIHFSLAINI